MESTSSYCSQTYQTSDGKRSQGVQMDPSMSDLAPLPVQS